MFKYLRTLIVIAAVLIAIAAIIRFTSTPAQPVRAASDSPTQVAAVDRGDIAVTVSATGPLQTHQVASLTFPAAGKVVALNVNEGDYVRKGQTLAMLDNQVAMDAYKQAQVKVTLQEIALNALKEKPRQVDINVLQTSLNVAKTNLQSSQGGVDPLQVQIDAMNVEKAKNTLWQTELQRDINNTKKDQLLSNPRTAPQAANLPSDAKQNGDINAGGYDVQIAQSQLDAAKSQTGNVGSIASAQAQITAAQVALDNLEKGADPNDIARATAELQAAQDALAVAKANLDKTLLIAPFDGVVAKLNIHAGEPTPQGAAATLLDTSTFYVDVPVAETDIAKVAVGQNATLTFDALPGVRLNGKVTLVLQAATKSGDVVNYPVRIEVDPAGKPLLPAMSATGSIITDQATSVLRLPNRFIRLDRNGKAFARVRQPDGTFKDVPITLGVRNDTYTEVKQGLNQGDVVGLPTTGTGGPGGGNFPAGAILGGRGG